MKTLKKNTFQARQKIKKTKKCFDKGVRLFKKGSIHRKSLQHLTAHLRRGIHNLQFTKNQQ